MKHLTHIEPLEDRIAPATIVNPYTVTFQDTDGDTAVVHISKPLFKSAAAAGNILIFSTSESFTGNSVGESLTTINLLGRTDAQDMSISVKVIPQVGVGNGQVDVGSIVAGHYDPTSGVMSQDIDLGSVTIQGNLGSIVAGDHFSTPAISSLTVMSMTTPANSFVLGPIVKMNVQGDFNANLNMLGSVFATIDSLKIGGSMAGDAAGDSGTGVINFSGHINSATIGNITGGAGANTGELIGNPNFPSYIGSLHVLGSITGGAGNNSGVVTANRSIGKLTVDGTGATGGIIGGSGSFSGVVQGPIGTVKIAGNLAGGSGIKSGILLGQSVASNFTTVLNAPINSVTIGGDVTGGAGANSGEISGILGTVIIKGNLAGGGGDSSGLLTSPTTIGNVIIGHDMTGGAGQGSGEITGTRLGTILVQGNLAGGSGISSGAILSQASPFAGFTVPEPVTSIVIDGNMTGGSAGVAKFGSTAAVAGDSGMISASSAQTIKIGGSLIGGTPGSAVNSSGVSTETADTSGVISVGNVTSLMIGKDVIGGGGPTSGIIEGTKYGSISVGGDIAGGAGSISGQINLGAAGSTLGKLNIGGNLSGGSGGSSGEIIVTGTAGQASLGAVTIGGNVSGGTGSNSGEILTAGIIKGMIIQGSLSGSQAINSTAAVTDSGYIQGGEIASLNIGGNVTAGVNAGTGALANCGAIRSSADIISLAIGGNVVGTKANPVVISAAQGSGTKTTSTTDLAIGTVAIGGNASSMDLLAGYGTDTTSSALGNPVDGSAQINSVTITGALAASNIVAGVAPDSGGFFGTTGDTAITPKLATNVMSSIAKIVVTGTATGDGTPADSFGIVAEKLLSVTVQGGSNLATGLIVGTPKAVGTTNLFLLEVT